MICSGAIVYWLNVQTHNTGVVSSIPAHVTIKTPLVMKAMEKHLSKSTSLKKFRPSLWFLLLLRSSMQRSSFLLCKTQDPDQMKNFQGIFMHPIDTAFCNQATDICFSQFSSEHSISCRNM